MRKKTLDILSLISEKSKWKKKIVMFGNKRSFSNIATSRKFKCNKQKFKLNSRNYFIPVKFLKVCLPALRKSF